MAKFAQTFLMVSLVAVSMQSQAAMSQTSAVSESSSSSSSTDEVVKGYAFKYKERFRNYAEQIDTAQTKGWLNAEKAGQFKGRLEQLQTEEAAAGKNGYPKAEVDTLDQNVTKFNQDLTDAEQKK